MSSGGNNGEGGSKGAARRGGAPASATFAPGPMGDVRHKAASSFEEEQPTMRSVMMAPPAPGLGSLRMGGGEPMKLGSISLDRPKSVFKKLPCDSGPLPDDAFEVLGSKHAKAQASNWIVNDSSLEPVPDCFVLERTSRFVGGTPASVVAARISDCFRDRSIAVVYDDEMVKAKCMTTEFVDFRVRLFAGRDEYSDGVIVEVQRRSGPSFIYHGHCRAILDASEGCYSQDYDPPVLKRPADMGLDENEDEDEKKRRRKDSSAKALEQSSCLLKKDRIDANLLGMESLVSLTDPEKSNPVAALAASKRVVNETETPDIHRVVAGFLEESIEEDDSNPELENPFQGQLRELALMVLNNSLSVTSEAGCLIDALQEQVWFVEQLVPLLVNEVRHVRSKPHCAFWATKCLNILINCSPEAKEKALCNDALDALCEAREYGMGKHSNLAKESELGVTALECAC